MQYFAGIELIDDETSDSIIEIAIKNFPICIILKNHYKDYNIPYEPYDHDMNQHHRSILWIVLIE